MSLLLLMIFSIKPARPSSCRASAHWLTTFGAAVNPLTFHNHALVTSTHGAASRRRIRRFVARETGATCGCCTSGWSGRRRGGSRYFPGASNRDTARPQIRFGLDRVPRTDSRLSPAERLMGLVGSARQRGPLPELTDANDFAMYGLGLLEVFRTPRPDYVAIICDIDRLCPRPASEDRQIMATRREQDKTVPDCVVKSQTLPDVKDRAERIENASYCEKP